MQGIVILSYFLERKKVHNITVVETEGFWKAMVKLDLIETRFFFFFFSGIDLWDNKLPHYGFKIYSLQTMQCTLLTCIILIVGWRKSAP